MRRSPFILLVLISTLEPALAQTTQPAAPSQSQGECLAFSDDGGVAAKALRSLTIAAGEKVQTLAEVRFSGLTTLSEEKLWQLVGGRPVYPFTIEQAAALIARLAGSGLFARVEPSLLIGAGPDGNAALSVQLAEHATVTAVDLAGLDELTKDELLEDLFVVPDKEDVERGGKPRKSGSKKDDSRVELRCPSPAPPRDWVARFEDDRALPGIVWRGLPAALLRVQTRIEREGYQLGRASATLDAAGKLTVTVDEGRLDAVVVEGVHPAIADRVQELLGVRAGSVFNSDDLEVGFDRIEEEYPFLSPRRENRPAPPTLDVVEERRPDGSVALSFRPGPPRCDEGDEDEDEDEIGDAVEELDDVEPKEAGGTLKRVFRRIEVRLDERVRREKDEDERGACEVRAHHRFEGRKLIVTMYADRFDLDADPIELLRHTQVTSYAPGLIATLEVWDPADRIHFALDTLFNVNSGRGSRTPRGTRSLEELAAAERIDFILQPRLSIPLIGLAELGGQVHSFVDTDDAWRITRFDSYLNSILFDRPDREYFRRTGLGAFATFHFLDAFTIGGEWRFDQIDSLNSLDDVDSIFGDNPGFPNPAIDSGIFGSLLFRLEWATTETRLNDVGSVRRPSQGTIVDLGTLWGGESALRTVSTFEIADPSLGGRFTFWRFTCDNVLSLAISDQQTVSLRGRVGGGEDLPIHLREALGGWGSLRGYEHKELFGDWSLLGSLEYRLSPFSAFLDVGAVRQTMTGDWQGPRAGVGVALNLWDDGQLAFAWRTDDAAEGEPEIRLLFGRAW